MSFEPNGQYVIGLGMVMGIVLGIGHLLIRIIRGEFATRKDGRDENRDQVGDSPEKVPKKAA